MEDISCSICMNEFHEKDVVPKMLECSHTFCADCIQAVHRSSRLCPICRQRMNRKKYPTNLSTLKFVEFCKQKTHASTSSISAVKSVAEVERRKLKVGEKIERLTGEIENLNEDILTSNGEIDKLNAKIEKLKIEIKNSNDKIQNKQTLLESLQLDFAQLVSLEEKLRDSDARETQKVTVQIKDPCLIDDQSGQEQEELPRQGVLTLKKNNFQDVDALRAEVARRVRREERVFCFEDVKGQRLYGKVPLREGSLLCHSLTLLREQLGHAATLVWFQELAPPRSAVNESFLLLQKVESNGPEILVRIQLEPHPFTPQFALLSTGVRGPSYKGAKVADERGRRWLWGSPLFSVSSYMDNGREGSGAIEPSSGACVTRDCVEGEVVVQGGGGGSFWLWKMKRRESLGCVVGVVTSPDPSAFESFPKGGRLRVGECGICVGL